ncbi:MAG: VOC family protein [Xanthobacteraceae bacterium]
MQTIVPYLTVKNAPEAIDFYVKALGAKEVSRAPAEDGRIMHADLTINGGSVFVMDEFPEHAGQGMGHTVHAPTPERPAPVAVVVNFGAPAEIDDAYRRAVDAGCNGVMEPQDTFWNARFAILHDPYGHQWMLNATLPAKN